MSSIRTTLALAILALATRPLLAQEPTPPAAAQAPAAPAVDSSTLASNVIFEAIIKLHARERIAAKIEQDVDILDQKFSLVGNYYKDTGNRVRLQLDLKDMPDSSSTMLQVSDGKILWEYQNVMGMKNYRRREITPILQRLEDPVLDDTFRAQVMAQLGFGGPEALLNGFQEKINFNQFSDETVDGVPSFVLRGTWKDRSGLLGANDRPLAPTADLPPYIPSNVAVFVAKDGLWPYKIEMKGKKPSLLEKEEDARPIDPATGRPVGRKVVPKVEPSKVTLRYVELPLTEIKPDEQFVFATPRNAGDVFDETKQFLDQLDQFIQIKRNEKRTKAAEGEVEPLKTSPLTVPIPPTSSSNPDGLPNTPPESPPRR